MFHKWSTPLEIHCYRFPHYALSLWPLTFCPLPQKMKFHCSIASLFISLKCAEGMQEMPRHFRYRYGIAFSRSCWLDLYGIAMFPLLLVRLDGNCALVRLEYFWRTSGRNPTVGCLCTNKTCNSSFVKFVGDPYTWHPAARNCWTLVT